MVMLSFVAANLLIFCGVHLKLLIICFFSLLFYSTKPFLLSSLLGRGLFATPIIPKARFPNPVDFLD